MRLWDGEERKPRNPIICTLSPLSHPQHKLWHGDRLKLDTIRVPNTLS